MAKGTKIWLWIALVLSVATTVLNAAYGRWVSVAIAVVALAGLATLLFTQRKIGFIVMCLCYVLAFAEGVFTAFTGEGDVLVSVLMSFVGSALIPVITFFFLRSQWGKLK